MLGIGAESSKNNCRSCRMLGHTVSDEARLKISKNHANVSGVNNPMFGCSRPDWSKYLKENSRGIPFYNPNSITIIEQYGKEYGYNFQHAENGGELCIGGYFPDGTDQKKMTIIEIDEKHHFNVNGSYKQEDIDRQKYLESLGYKVIRIKF